MMRFLRSFFPVFLLFLIVHIASYTLASTLSTLNIDTRVVLWGNFILLLATLGSFIFYSRSVSAQKMHAFLRNIYAGMFIKFGLCMMSAFFYILILGKNVNKWGIITVLGLYVIYTILEVIIVFRLNKK